MNILLISPLGFPVTPDKYIGIEKLVAEYVKELIKEHKVTVMGHADSVYADGVFLLGTRPRVGDVFLLDELQQYQSYQYVLRDFDVIHDFSHQHLASRYNVNLPSVNPFWHAPGWEVNPTALPDRPIQLAGRYNKSPYNIIGLSLWACREFKRVYRQNARYMQSVVIDTSIYKLSQRHRGDRFLTLGIMQPHKGNLEAVMLCKRAGIPLDVVGGRGAGVTANTPLSEYEQTIRKECDGKQIKFWGEVTDDQKIKLMQGCRALIYITNFPEINSHKTQECMLIGAPVLVPAIGAMPEIVTNKVNGFLCSNEGDYLNAIKDIDKLNPKEVYEDVKETYAVGNVCQNYVELYQKVKEGLRW